MAIKYKQFEPTHTMDEEANLPDWAVYGQWECLKNKAQKKLIGKHGAKKKKRFKNEENG